MFAVCHWFTVVKPALREMKMVHTLVALVLLAIAGVPCSAIPREDMLDFGTVQAGGRGGGWNMLNQPVHFFGLSVGFSQVSSFQTANIYIMYYGHEQLEIRYGLSVV